MKRIRINGDKYELRPYTGEKLEWFYYRGLFMKVVPANKQVQSVFTMDDVNYGVVKDNSVRAIVGVILCILVTVLLVAILFTVVSRREKLPQSNSDVTVDAPTIEGNVSAKLNKTSYTLVYNRYTLLNDGYIDIMYSNIDEPVTLKVQAAGVSSNSLEVEAEEYIPVFKVNVEDTVEFPTRAELLVTIKSKEYVVPIVISDIETTDYTQLRKNTVNRVDTDSIDEDYYKPETFVDEERNIGD